MSNREIEKLLTSAIGTYFADETDVAAYYYEYDGKPMVVLSTYLDRINVTFSFIKETDYWRVDYVKTQTDVYYGLSAWSVYGEFISQVFDVLKQVV